MKLLVKYTEILRKLVISNVLYYVVHPSKKTNYLESAMAFDPSTLFDVSHLVTFVGGALVGGAGQYLADRFTDQRRAQESQFAEGKQFAQLKVAMPELLNQMAQDLKGDESKSIREFVLVPNRRVSFNSGKPRFTYYTEDNPAVQIQVDRLLSAGYLDDVTIGDAPIYRMREQFVELIQKHHG